MVRRLLLLVVDLQRMGSRSLLFRTMVLLVGLCAILGKRTLLLLARLVANVRLGLGASALGNVLGFSSGTFDIGRLLLLIRLRLLRLLGLGWHVVRRAVLWILRGLGFLCGVLSCWGVALRGPECPEGGGLKC